MKFFENVKNKVKIKKVASEDKRPSIITKTLVGSIAGVCVSLVLVLIFAFMLKFFPISDGIIRPINQVIKCLSLLFGAFIALRKHKENGLVTGLLIGLLYTLFAFVVFSALDGNFEFNKTLVNDLLFGGIIGAIAGIIAVNFGKKK